MCVYGYYITNQKVIKEILLATHPIQHKVRLPTLLSSIFSSFIENIVFPALNVWGGMMKNRSQSNILSIHLKITTKTAY